MDVDRDAGLHAPGFHGHSRHDRINPHQASVFMITLTSAELNTWIAAFLWPLTRIIGLISTAPLFGNVSVPARAKIVLGIMLALILSPTVPALPAMDPMSLAGLLILI